MKKGYQNELKSISKKVKILIKNLLNFIKLFQNNGRSGIQRGAIVVNQEENAET